MTIPEYVDEDSFLWLAFGIPNAGQYAEALLMTQRDLAREMLAARKTDHGWQYRYEPDQRLIRQLRELGLCGEGGYYLSNYALVVRNRLLQIIATRELEHPLENDPSEAAE